MVICHAIAYGPNMRYYETGYEEEENFFVHLKITPDFEDGAHESRYGYGYGPDEYSRDDEYDNYDIEGY